MGTLAHVFEEYGLATIAISLVRGQIERSRPPRALHCAFPLGRPLGVPGNQEFQHRVLRAAFSLLENPGPGPVLVDFDEELPEQPPYQYDETLMCILPPRHDRFEHPAVDEALSLRPAFERTRGRFRRSDVGRVVNADGVPKVLAALIRLTSGLSPEEAGVPGGDLVAASMDLRAYYEEAALSLLGRVPAPGEIEHWIYHQTQAGNLMRTARNSMRSRGIDRKVWYYLLPRAEQEPDEVE